ncbi:hypothetical protein JHK85_040763 [Glycine max]|uniref:Uncharacterized protein n=1 Tax=Glycine soja TaxID=3848 RepID=A0A0B2S437_GLYSO|nr:hypothetical protein JHK85_040763 [Glycine max]KHN38967.1 hypothetical protein glysoja_035095 [Glycine soja]
MVGILQQFYQVIPSFPLFVYRAQEEWSKMKHITIVNTIDRYTAVTPSNPPFSFYSHIYACHDQINSPHFHAPNHPNPIPII